MTCDPLLRLCGRDDEVYDIRFFRTGFRSIAIRDRVFLFNGRPSKFHGVNRHEFDPDRGRAVTRAGMEEDIRLIKAAHFDAVRSSHYPNDPRWYELCDRAGLRVLDEANIESHGLSYHRCVLPGDDPEWEPAVLDRIERLVRTNRNHVSITLWSLGNEAGYGNAFTDAAARIRELDPRPKRNFRAANRSAATCCRRQIRSGRPPRYHCARRNRISPRLPHRPKSPLNGFRPITTTAAASPNGLAKRGTTGCEPPSYG